jgi:hypothetical protein
MARRGTELADVTRASLPELLFVPDLCAALGGISGSAVRRAVHRGECGPFLYVCGRIAVRRESFLAALKEREIHPEPRRDASCPPGTERYAALLRGRPTR